MIVLCATWRAARDVYDLLCIILRYAVGVKPLLMYGAMGDRDIEVRTYKLEFNSLYFFDNLVAVASVS